MHLLINHYAIIKLTLAEEVVDGFFPGFVIVLSFIPFIDFILPEC